MLGHFGVPGFLGSRYSDFETKKTRARELRLQSGASEPKLRSIAGRHVWCGKLLCVERDPKVTSAAPPNCFEAFAARKLRMQSYRQHARHMLWVFDPQTHDSHDKEEEDGDYRDAAVVCILTDSNGYDSDKVILVMTVAVCWWRW